MLVDTILDKKGSDILLLDIREQAVFADYFLLCSGTNARQLKAMVDSIVTESKSKAGFRSAEIEGEADGGWMLVDFGDVLVHAFAPEQRHYYALEELWSNAHVVLRMQ